MKPTALHCSLDGTKFTYESDGLSFSFYRDIKSLPVTKQNLISKLPTEAKVYLLLKEDPAQTREMLASKTGRTV